MAAVTTGVVLGGASLYNSYEQGQAAKDASRAQAQGVRNAQAQQREFTDKAVSQLMTQYGNARRALSGVPEQSGLLLDEAGNILSGGLNKSDQILSSGFNDAINTLSPTYQQGANASSLQAALSGASGVDAQRDAFANFVASPGQDYLRNQQEQSILRNAAALGGGLGAQPEVMQALQENAAGLAQQDFSNSYARLSELSGRGDAAANSIANLRTSLAGGRAGIAQSLAQSLAGIKTDKANINANTQQQIAQLLANQGNSISNAYMGAGSEQAQLAQNLGQANSAYDIYKSQNMNPILQGLTAGVGGYTGAGGGFGGITGLLGGGGGATQAGYTGTAYQNWLNQQRAVK